MPAHETFSSKNAVAEAVAGRLQERGTSPEISHAVSDAVATWLEDDQTSMSARADLIVRRWVVRDGDIDVLQSLTDAAVAATSAKLLEQEDAFAALAAVVVALFRTVRALRRKGVILDPASLAILVAIKQNDGISDDALAELLRDQRKPAADHLDEALAFLQGVALPDHTVVPLIQQDAAGGWHALA